MAVQFKLTIKRGQHPQDVTTAAGTSISGSDAIELNVDVTNMSKGECVILLEQLKIKVLQAKFPPL